MRVCYVLLVAAATLIATNATASHTQLSETTTADAIQSIDAAQKPPASERFLRRLKTADEDENEERGPTPLNRIMTLDDLVKPAELDAALKASKNRQILFDNLYAATPSAREEVFKQILAERKYDWLKPLYVNYLHKKGVVFDKNEIAAALRIHHGTT